MKSVFFLFLLFLTTPIFGQVNDNAEILKKLLTTYYANEKVIVKGRLQLLYLYCNKSPNNEELLEVIPKSNVLRNNEKEIKKHINSSIEENWNLEFKELFTNQNQHLKSKVQDCVSLEDFQLITKKHGKNNQRLMILGKPIFFGKIFCLIKVVFYRTIEHNNGCFFLLEKTNGEWLVKEKINEWNT